MNKELENTKQIEPTPTEEVTSGAAIALNAIPVVGGVLGGIAQAFVAKRQNARLEEFLRELGETNLLTDDQKQSLGKFLESCDLVKFAKYEPGENELRELHGSALRLVEETEPRPTTEELKTVEAPQ